MDFKNYVKMMLEAEKAEDKNKKAEDEDSEEDSEEDETDEEEKEASVKTKKGCTGCEASDNTEDSEDEKEDDSEDEKEDSEDEKEASCCTKKPSLREEMMMTSKNMNGKSYTLKAEASIPRTKIMEDLMNNSRKISSYNAKQNKQILVEEVFTEGIKNNSASRYLAKLAKRAEKEAAKYESKGAKDAAKVSKKAASSLKEASNKLYKCETRYQAGDVSAKKEYKQICKEYSKELKNMGRGVKGLKALIFTLVAGAVLLGGIGLTAAANDDIIDKLNTGFKNPEKFPEIAKGLAVNDKVAIEGILNNVKEGKGIEGVKDALNNAKERAGDDYFDKAGKITNWAKQKSDWEAQKDGWDSAADRDNNWGFKTGKKAGETVKSGKEALKQFGKSVSKTATGIGKGFAAGK